MEKSVAAIQPLWDALNRQVIPQAREDAVSLLLAQLALEKMSPLPESISIKPRKRRGERVVAGYSKGAQIAHWPDDNLEATRFPSLCYILGGRATFQIADYELYCPADGDAIFDDAALYEIDGE